MTETLMERQLEREEDQVTNGEARYHRHRERNAFTDTKPGKALVHNTLERMIEALDTMVAEVESGAAGKNNGAVYAYYLPHFHSEPVAYITARAVLNSTFRNDTLTKCALVLSNMIEENMMFEQLKVDEPKLSNSMERKAKRWTRAASRRNIMRTASKVAGVTGLAWTEPDKVRLGMKLIEVFIESTGLCEIRTTFEGKNSSPKRIHATEATSEWLKNADDKFAVLEPRYTPMLVPPKKWTDPLNGGYITKSNRVKVISRMSDAQVDDMMSMDMSSVYSALNVIQETPWRVNRPVYDVMTELWDAGSPLAGLPDRDWLPEPERPFTEEECPKTVKLADMEPETHALMKAWVIAKAKVHTENARLISQRAAVSAQVSMASDVKDEQQFYFPHNLDFRGRLYSVVPSLNPQSDDIGKGLIEFAEGKPLGDSGGYWLAVHVANLFGVDKVSFDDRVAWTQENSNAIIDSANDPLDGQRFWTEADDPWCALAACFEWAGFQVDGDDHVSHMPVAMDGSCSGIQHFSAMLRDKAGGMAVNLLPVDAPADIYNEVKDKTIELLREEGDPQGIIWCDYITRKIVKRPCMTFAYSVTSRGMRDQILDELNKTGEDLIPGTNNYMAATFLAPYVERAIHATVDRAAEAMTWLKAAVRPVLEEEIPVSWQVPDGMPVAHRYVKTTGKRFNVWFQGVRTKVQLRVEGTKHDIRKQQAAIAPNYVHSMDACHLRMVVNRMMDEGITNSFAMIHDSFGTHACDIDELHYAIRDEFIQLYRVNRLEEFKQRMMSVVTDERVGDVPDVPADGELDLEEIRNAEFFFS
jgi:DNA-directed RNA polymerase